MRSRSRRIGLTTPGYSLQRLNSVENDLAELFNLLPSAETSTSFSSSQDLSQILSFFFAASSFTVFSTI